MTINLQTWARLKRISLQELSIALGNRVVSVLGQWPRTGEGRQIKAATERITRLLDSAHDRDVYHAFDSLDQALNELRLILTNPFFQRVLARKMHVSRLGARQSFGSLIEGHITDFDNFLAVHRPSKDEISKIQAAPPPTFEDIDFSDRLLKIAPEQQIGPLQFEFCDGVLRIKHDNAESDDRDRHNITSANNALISEGNYLIENLIASNCDQRLTETVQSIHEKVSTEIDIIHLGIANLACGQMVSRFEAELPEVVAARLEGYSVGVSLFVGQYPAWHRFVENAAAADYDLTDVRRIYEAGTALLPHLREASTIVNPEVPRSVEWVLEAISNPRRSSKRALFGAIRTLENLLARIFTEFANLLRSASAGANSGVKRGTSVIAAAGLLYAAANAAADLSPAAGRIAKANWLEQAAKLVKRGLENGE